MAVPAALAALAANKQGKFWEYHDRLFAEEEITEQSLETIAAELKLDLGTFNADRKSQPLLALMKSDVEEANRLGVTGTPTIFINGVQYVGDITREGLLQHICYGIEVGENRPEVCDGVKLGDSIAINGACLTVVDVEGGAHVPSAVGFAPGSARFSADGSRLAVVSDGLLATFDLEHVQPHCVLAHIDVQAEVEKANPGSTALWFQSIAGSEGALAGLTRTVTEPIHYFWVTGALSAFLDNAPTYLTFFNTALGSYRRVLSKDDLEYRAILRRSVVSRRAIKAGEIITEDMISYKRPGSGIQIQETQYVINRKASRDIPVNVIVSWDDIQ